MTEAGNGKFILWFCSQSTGINCAWPGLCVHMRVLKAVNLAMRYFGNRYCFSQMYIYDTKILKKKCGRYCRQH